MPTPDCRQDGPPLHTLKHQKSLRRLSASLTHGIVRKAILPYAAYADREVPYAELYAVFFLISKANALRGIFLIDFVSIKYSSHRRCVYSQRG